MPYRFDAPTSVACSGSMLPSTAGTVRATAPASTWMARCWRVQPRNRWRAKPKRSSPSCDRTGADPRPGCPGCLTFEPRWRAAKSRASAGVRAPRPLVGGDESERRWQSQRAEPTAISTEADGETLDGSTVMARRSEGPTGSAIRMRGFAKRFGAIRAVDGLDLDVPCGTCIGLLGPNGAGKSTTMKALTAQVIADAGELEVLGYRLPEDSKQARAQMGVVPQLDNLDVSLTVEQNLLVFAHLYRVPAAARTDAVERALDVALLADRRAAKVSELSGGMRRRLLIARALLHGPRLVLLDEPTVGLDPQVRVGLWALIDRMRSEGVSILMSTHYIEEAERLCDEVTT